jgi:hypothetical protein
MANKARANAHPQSMTMAEVRQKNNGHANLLKRSSPTYEVSLGAQSPTALGQTLTWKIKNTGYITGFYLTLSLTTVIGVAAATLSPRGLYAYITRIRFVDYSNTDRLNLSGYQLFVRNSVISSRDSLAGMSNLASASSVSQVLAGVTSGIINPNVTLTVGTNVQKLIMYIPVAANVDAGDLRGMLLAETTEGEARLIIETASTLYTNGNDDSVFNGAPTSTVAFSAATFELFQIYYYPQAVKGILPKPMLDMRTIYELNGNARSLDNFSAGTDKFISLMNNRVVKRLYLNYQNNGILGGSTGNELTSFKYLVGGSNFISVLPEQVKQFQQLARVGTPLPKGSYFFEWDHGIKTDNFGATQVAITPGGTLVAPYVEYMSENLILANSPLSSIAAQG